jgi:hypothetical protein
MKIISSLIVLLLLVSCTTSMLWDATDPHEYVVISKDEITEEELQEKGLDYEVSEKWNVYYVEKNVLQKTRDYMYRSFATPVTVTVDVAMPVLVIGGMSYAAVNADGPVDVDFGEFMNFLLLRPDEGEVYDYQRYL